MSDDPIVTPKERYEARKALRKRAQQYSDPSLEEMQMLLERLVDAVERIAEGVEYLEPRP